MNSCLPLLPVYFRVTDEGMNMGNHTVISYYQSIPCQIWRDRLNNNGDRCNVIGVG